MSNQNQMYTVLGGITQEWFHNRRLLDIFRFNSTHMYLRPLLSGAKYCPIIPIIIKATTAAEANAALGLQAIFKRIGLGKVETDPDGFARSLAASNQISDMGKTQRAIYVYTLCSGIHGSPWRRTPYATSRTISQRYYERKG
ncbi:hypothetical protein B0H16DRAFT_1487329 [Mycena metata]|uniref:Uncharacterized protein n=1 Tax=Mycena metata TaxID=1033252 RepID=A0AAD7DDD0_9AGAR|nr:hypothetical protein B0H16DRAFT_1487329 [Mycena metata]